MTSSIRNKLLFHCLSLCAIVTLLIAKTLNQWILVLAIGLLGANIYSIINLTINSQDEELNYDSRERPSKAKNESKPNFDVGRFEQKVRSAFQRNFNKNSNYIEEENKYWNSGYFSLSERAQELKNIKISDLRKDRKVKQDYDSCFRQESLTIKKVRNFLQTKEKQDESNIKYLQELIISTFAKLGGHYSKLKVTDIDVKQALQTIQTYINNRISNNYDQISLDFNEVNKFLQKCFSITLSLSQSTSQASINYTQLIQITNLIQKRQVIPHAFSSNLTPLQIKKELSAVRKNLDDLLNFCLPVNVLKLKLFVQYLKQEFKEQNIMFSKMQTDERINVSSHLFKCQENGKVYYHKQSKIKSRCSATPILAFLISNFDQYSKTNKALVKELKSVFNL